MAVSSSYLAFIAEQLTPLGDIGIKRMFGGASICCGGVIFALVDGDALYLKVDAAAAGKFEAEGMGPLVYPSKNGQMTMERYRRCPERLFDDDDELLVWARASLAIAEAAPRIVKPRAKTVKRPAAPK